MKKYLLLSLFCTVSLLAQFSNPTQGWQTVEYDKIFDNMDFVASTTYLSGRIPTYDCDSMYLFVYNPDSINMEVGKNIYPVSNVDTILVTDSVQQITETAKDYNKIKFTFVDGQFAIDFTFEFSATGNATIRKNKNFSAWIVRFRK